jgi:hypothetical protein
MATHDHANPPREHAVDRTLSTLQIRARLEQSLRAAKDGKVISQEEMERRYLCDTGREFLL